MDEVGPEGSNESRSKNDEVKKAASYGVIACWCF